MGEKKYIVIKRGEKTVSMLFHGSRLMLAHAQEAGGWDNILGNIYVARVKNIVKNLYAAFVEIAPGRNCYLDLRDAKEPILLNRSYDGRLVDGDEVMVQVVKEAIKTKPPAVTCALSLDGKYCVISKGKPGIAYSAKLSEGTKERIRRGFRVSGFPLEEYAKSFGIVVRTNAKELGEDLAPLEQEIGELSVRLERIVENGIHRTCYSALLQKPAGYLQKLRDMQAGWCEEIVTDEEGIYEEIRSFAEGNPDFRLPAVRLYQDERLSLAKLYNVEQKLKEALGKMVWLKSGGYLLIEPTEALTVIDVNTGKAVCKKEVQETHFQINMEAAEEIARQLALRNLSGIIMVDFINMKKEEYREALMSHLRELVRKDSVKTTLVDITALGLVEITRMKKNRPLVEQLERWGWQDVTGNSLQRAECGKGTRCFDRQNRKQSVRTEHGKGICCF